MGPIKLDPKITGQMKSWGDNYNTMDGCGHNTMADKVTQEIDSKDITLNVPSKMDTAHPKVNGAGVDKAFWGKANPLMDTQGHGKLSRKLKD